MKRTTKIVTVFIVLTLLPAGCGTSVAHCPKKRGRCPSTCPSTCPSMVPSTGPSAVPSTCPPKRPCPWLEPRTSNDDMGGRSALGTGAILRIQKDMNSVNGASPQMRAGASRLKPVLVRHEVLVAAPVEHEPETPSQEAPMQAATVVELTDQMRYQPSQIIIPVDGTVEWKNVSQLTHTVTADPSLAVNQADVQLPEGVKPFNSGNILPGQTFVHSFPVPGNYRCFCIPHELNGMIGEVTVKETAK